MSGNDTKLDPSNGVVEGYNGDNVNILRSMTAFSAIAWYNAFEIILLIFIVFKKYEGLYFWSLLVTSFTIIPYQLGVWTHQMTLKGWPHLLPVAFTNLGWVVMIPGQSVVLYSRLHLVCQNDKLLRFVVWVIVIDWIVFAIPTSILTWGANIESPSQDAFIHGYRLMERIQMPVFSAQEIFISSIYLWEVRKILHTVFERGTRRIMWELVMINVTIILLDVVMVVVEYLDFYQIQTNLKGMIYSIKLKLEFGVLSKLVKMVTNKNDTRRLTSDESNLEGGGDMNLNKVSSTAATAGSESKYTSSTRSHHRHHSSSTKTKKWRQSSDVAHIENAAGVKGSIVPDDNIPFEWRRSYSKEQNNINGNGNANPDQQDSATTAAERKKKQAPEIRRLQIPDLRERSSERSMVSDVSYPGRLL